MFRGYVVTEREAREDGPERAATYGEIFRAREFQAVWGAQILSVVGDWLAQVALAILVFERTGSALFSALTYALIFLPQFLGGPFLAGLADMLPRRAVMIVSDIGRAVLIALMAISNMPFWSLLVLLFMAHLLAAPFGAARAAIMPDILPGDRYVLGISVTNITHQAGQIAGFVVGGGVVAAFGSSKALLLDAGTFAVSALLLWIGVKERPPAAERSSGVPDVLGSLAAGARIVFGNPQLRAIVVMAWLCAFYAVPEGLGAPYVDEWGGGDRLVGVFLAAMPVGAIIGMTVIGRFVAPARRYQLMRLLALLSCAPLMVTAAFPGVGATLTVLAVVGFASAYQLPANAAFVRIVPDSGRGQAFGLVQAGINVFQGLAIVAAGAAAQVLQPQLVVAISGAVGTCVALWTVISWSRAPALSEALSEPAPQR